MAEGVDVSGGCGSEDDVARALIELVMFPYYWKFKLGAGGQLLGGFRNGGIAYFGKLNKSVEAKERIFMVDILVPRSTIICSQRVDQGCRKRVSIRNHKQKLRCHKSSTRETDP